MIKEQKDLKCQMCKYFKRNRKNVGWFVGICEFHKLPLTTHYNRICTEAEKDWENFRRG